MSQDTPLTSASLLAENSVCYSAPRALGTEKSQRLAFCFLLITWFIVLPMGFLFELNVPTECGTSCWQKCDLEL